MVLNDLTQEYIKQILNYDPDTGEFVWRVNRHNRKLKGKIAGGISIKDHGYVEIRIDGKKYYAHRLAYLIMTGKWPKNEVDHMDRNRSNNILSNLRIVSQSDNCKNCNRKHRPVCQFDLTGKFMCEYDSINCVIKKYNNFHKSSISLFKR